MKRKCRNWLETFLEWTLPRSEAPESLLIWSALFCIAAVAKRKVFFPKSLLGSYEIYPNLYVIFVGPPAVVRKSTTAGYNEELLHDLNEILGKQNDHRITLGPTSGSDSKLIEELVGAVDGSMTIISSEFGNLVKTTPEGMYDVLTHLFDNPRVYDYKTRMHGTEIVYEPSLNVLGCTTPSWIAENPGYMVGGGFASRVLFVYENKARQRRMYYDDVIWPDMEQMRSDLVHDLELMCTIEGPFEHDSTALKIEMETWYVGHADKDHEDQVGGFHNRKHLHLHKVAMLLSMCERSDRVITKIHFDSALALIEAIETNMPRALSVVGRNPYSASLHTVLDFIEENGPVPKATIIARFWHDLRSEETAEILNALLITGRIEKASGAADKVAYQIRKGA